MARASPAERRSSPSVGAADLRERGRGRRLPRRSGRRRRRAGAPRGGPVVRELRGHDRQGAHQGGQARSGPPRHARSARPPIARDDDRGERGDRRRARRRPRGATRESVRGRARGGGARREHLGADRPEPSLLRERVRARRGGDGAPRGGQPVPGGALADPAEEAGPAVRERRGARALPGARGDPAPRQDPRAPLGGERRAAERAGADPAPQPAGRRGRVGDRVREVGRRGEVVPEKRERPRGAALRGVARGGGSPRGELGGAPGGARGADRDGARRRSGAEMGRPRLADVAGARGHALLDHAPHPPPHRGLAPLDGRLRRAVRRARRPQCRSAAVVAPGDPRLAGARVDRGDGALRASARRGDDARGVRDGAQRARAPGDRARRRCADAHARAAPARSGFVAHRCRCARSVARGRAERVHGARATRGGSGPRGRGWGSVPDAGAGSARGGNRQWLG